METLIKKNLNINKLLECVSLLKIVFSIKLHKLYMIKILEWYNHYVWIACFKTTYESNLSQQKIQKYE